MSTGSMDQSTAGKNAGPRWWPVLVILGLTVLATIYNMMRDVADPSQKSIFGYVLLVVVPALLLAWLLFFSRLTLGTKLKTIAAALGLVVLFFGLFEIEGVDGDVVPIIAFRWGGAPDFGGQGQASKTSDVAGVTNPGPNDFPQFYGARRDAMIPGVRLARDWEANPPREVWRHDVGAGWSAFAIADDAAVTQELRGEDEVVVRYELTTGKQVWAQSDPEVYLSTIGGDGPRATPTIADDHVYAMGATGVLNRLDLATGERVWSRNVLEDHDAKLQEWGMSNSPLIAGDLVVVALGEGGKHLAAYDRATGEPAWHAGDEPGSYMSPLLTTLAGREQIINLNARSIVAHDPATGEILWREPWDIPGQRCSTPLNIDGQRLLASVGYGVGSRMLDVTANGDGFQVKELWETRRLKSKYAPIVWHRGTIFGLDEGILTAINPNDGERLWKKGRYGHGQLLLIGDLLLILTEKGDLVLVEANPDEHRELARLKALDGKTWNAPALAGRYLLVRNHREAVCYELALES